ncbi:MAG TPA: molybdopterin-binding protein, partial [Burkholderiaceae bacterium]|nr:molybdopterin-binding protein [Burkholderiaceae bacterium]
LGLATAVGATHLDVRRRLRIGVASTGDELHDPPHPLPAGTAYDANRPLLRAALDRLSFEALDLGICADRAQAFDQLLEAAFARELDALVTSGGAAQGDADVVRKAAAIRFLPLQIRPGRGIAFARIEHGRRALALFGLPGNAVAAFVMFHLVARPALLHLAGATAGVPAHVPLPLACDVQVRGGCVDYRRARLLADGEHVAVMPLKEQGSAMLRTVTDADLLIALGPRSEYRAGEMVPSILIDALDD